MRAITVYICLLVYISFLGGVFFLKKPYYKYKNIGFLFWALFGMFLIQALRSIHVGWDIERYCEMFFAMRNGTYYYYRIEPLFKELIKFSAAVTDNQQVFLSFCSLIILCGFGFFALKNTEEGNSVFWPVFLFLVLIQFFSSMNILRQYVAIAFCCNIFTVLKRGFNVKNVFISAILLLLGFLFHRTALVCVLLFIPFIIKPSRKIILLGFAAGLSVYFLFPVLFKVFIQIFPIYARYIGSKHDQANTSIYHILLAFFYVVIGALYLIYINPDKKENYASYRLLMVVIISFALIVAEQRIELAMRLGYYFELYIVLLIPDFINKWKDIRVNRIMKIGVYLMGWVFFLYTLMAGVAKGCVPYSFYWQ